MMNNARMKECHRLALQIALAVGPAATVALLVDWWVLLCMAAVSGVLYAICLGACLLSSDFGRSQAP